MAYDNKVKKTRIFTEEHRMKLREAKLKNPTRYWLGKNLSKEAKEKLSKIRKGRVVNSDTRKKISLANKGIKRSREFINNLSGENNVHWKGIDAKYGTKHDWIENHKGKANICSFNPDHKTNRYAWANISGSYLRDIDDYVSLCSKCHRQYDIIRNNYMNLGRKGIAYKNYKEVISIWKIM